MVTDLHNREHVMTVEVPTGGGAVWVRAGDGRAYKLSPETVSKLRKIYADALAAALQDRGTW